MTPKIQEVINNIYDSFYDLIILDNKGIERYGSFNVETKSAIYTMGYIINQLKEVGLECSSDVLTYNLRRVHESSKEYKDSVIQGEGI
jgi:hypothetical protein